MATNNVALITGCSTGIGRALVHAFAEKGYRVFATARRPETLDDLRSDRVDALPLDVVDEASRRTAVEAVIERAGRIDVLVNNAGYGQMGPLLDLTPEQLREQFETNVVAAIAMVQAVAPHMVARKSGCIVNIGSISGILSTPFAGAYCASKAALHLLSDALRMELAPFGIHVVIVRPGGVRSAIGANASKALRLREDSRYAAIADSIRRRANASQEKAEAAEDAARTIVAAVERERPPHIVPVGSGKYLYPALKWFMPGRRLDRMLMNRFGLNKLESQGV